MDVITYPCWDYKLIHVSKSSPWWYNQSKTMHNKTMCIFYGIIYNPLWLYRWSLGMDK